MLGTILSRREEATKATSVLSLEVRFWRLSLVSRDFICCSGTWLNYNYIIVFLFLVSRMFWTQRTVQSRTYSMNWLVSAR